MKAKMIRQGANNLSYFSKDKQSKQGLITFEPSVKKMKEDINNKDSKNQELSDEVNRLKSMLKDSVNENEMNFELLNEVKIKEEQLADKETELEDNQKVLKEVETEKTQLKTHIDELKQQQFKDRKNLALIKQTSSQNNGNGPDDSASR
jgi:DNA repair exonuclease SbcCD ATPase subunit